MKVLSLALAALALGAFTHPAHAALRNSPFPPYIDQRFSDLEDDVAEGSAIARKYAKVVYDVALDGGSSTANKSLGITLPADAIITGFYAYINTAFTKAGGGAGVASVALQCGGTRNIMEYVNISSYAASNYMAKRLGDFSSQVLAGYNQPTSLVRQNEPFLSDAVASVPTACEVTAVVRGNSGYEAYTAGKFTAVIEYFSR